jgi:hypothetical protein
MFQNYVLDVKCKGIYIYIYKIHSDIYKIHSEVGYIFYMDIYVQVFTSI